MFSYSCFLSDVEVPHPYEPVICKPVYCDYYIFRNDSFTLSSEDIYCCIISFLAKKFNNEYLFKNYGIVIVCKYFDNTLNSFSYLEISNIPSDMIEFITNTLKKD